MPTLIVPKGQQVAPTKATGDREISPGAFSGETAALDRLGATVKGAGTDLANIELKMQTMAREVELDKAQVAYDEFLDKSAADRLKDTNFAGHRQNFDSAHDAFTRQYLETVKGDKAKQQLSTYFARMRAREGTQVASQAHRALVAEKRRLQPQARQISIEAELADPQEEGQAGERQLYIQRLDELVAAGHMTPADKQNEMRLRAIQLVQTAADRDPAVVAKILDDGQLEVLLAEEDIKLLSPDDLDSMRADANRELSFKSAAAKQELEAAQNEQKQAIVDRFIGRKFAKTDTDDDIETFINSQPDLDPDEKIQWIERAQRWADNINNGKKIQTNELAKTKLEQRALDIRTGAVSRADFELEAIEAFYGKSPTIDEDAFADVMKIANREHVAYQANAMGEAINYAQRQMLSQGTLEEMAAARVSATGENYDEVIKKMEPLRRAEEENFSQMKRAMNEWFEAEKKAGRDPDDDDIYVKSRKLVKQFRAKLTDDLAQATAVRRGKELFAQSEQAFKDFFQQWPLRDPLEPGKAAPLALPDKGLEPIWAELDPAERKTATDALNMGMKPADIIKYFNKNKNKQ